MASLAWVLSTVPDDVREAIRRKACWERMTLRAVLREWWPDLYALLDAPPSHGTPAARMSRAAVQAPPEDHS